MKALLKHTKTSLFLTALMMLVLPLTSFSQDEGSGNVQKEGRNLPEFNKIQVGSAFTLYLTQGEPSVMVETDDNLKDNIETLVDNNVLKINSTGIKNPTSLKVHVSAPNITDISLSGASRLESIGVLEYPVLRMRASGASRANIELNTQELYTEVTGASRVTLRGSANNHISDVSGASNVNALMLKTITTTANVNGAARMSVFAKNQLTSQVRDAGSITYFDNPDIKRLRQTGTSVITLNNPDDAVPSQSNETIENNIEIKVFEDGDSTFIKIGDLEVQIEEHEEKTKIDIGKHNLEIDDDGNVKFKKRNKDKFDGHWAGFDIGVNGLLNSDFSTQTPPGYDYLKLKMEKSIFVGVNLFEQNFNLISENFGMITGLGLEWNNFRFNDNVSLSGLDDTLSGFRAIESDTNYIKSKLVTTYLTLPLMFELQSNSYSKVNSFHLGFGVLTGLRIGTHTKEVYDTGTKKTDKKRGSTIMNPFKLDLMARAGWGKINLWAKYSLIELFDKGKGPEVYPYSVGISLVNW